MERRENNDLMKALFLILVLMPMSRAAEVSVRAYRVPSLASVMQIEAVAFFDPWSEPEPPEKLSPQPLKRPLFASRFFEGHGELFDFGDFLSNRFSILEKEIQGVFESKSRRLVERTSLDFHDQLKRRLLELHSFQIRIKATLFSVPGVAFGPRKIEVEKANWSSSVSCLHFPDHRVSLRRQGMSLEFESLFEFKPGVIENRMTLESEMAKVSFKSAFWQRAVEDHVIELGSPDGRETWVFLVEQDLFLPTEAVLMSGFYWKMESLIRGRFLNECGTIRRRFRCFRRQRFSTSISCHWLKMRPSCLISRRRPVRFPFARITRI